MAARTATIWAAGIVAALALTGCGSDGEITLPSALPSGSIELPTPTRSEEPAEEPAQEVTEAPPEEPAETPTEEPTEAPTEAPTEEPTEEPTEAPTEEPTETPTEAPTEEPTETPTETESETPTESESASAEASDSGDSTLPLWLGLAAVLAALGALAWFLVARSRGRKWDERLDVERTQAQWVVNKLVPALTSPATPTAAVIQDWAGAQPTLNQLDANLAALVADAPDDTRAQEAQSIASAATQVRSSAGAHVALVTSGTATAEALGASAASVQTATNQLATILGPEQPPAGGQQPPPAEPTQPPAS